MTTPLIMILCGAAIVVVTVGIVLAVGMGKRDSTARDVTGESHR